MPDAATVQDWPNQHGAMVSYGYPPSTPWRRLIWRVFTVVRRGSAIRVQFQTTDGEWRYLGQRRAK